MRKRGKYISMYRKANGEKMTSDDILDQGARQIGGVFTEMTKRLEEGIYGVVKGVAICNLADRIRPEIQTYADYLAEERIDAREVAAAAIMEAMLGW